MPRSPFRLYPRRAEPTLDPSLFANPTREYRGTPFWCWNDRLDPERLRRQLDVIARMGFGGFHIHSRTGLATPYLGEEWMRHVRAVALDAERRGMLCWLYDEDRWPSGYAGGLVTREPAHRQRHLLWTRTPYGQGASRGYSDYTTAVRTETGRLLARFRVELDAQGRLAAYRRLKADEESAPADPIWYAYVEPAAPSSWFNGQTAVDVFSRTAIERFLEATHDRYAHDETLAPLFGSTIAAFFTDEPQFVKKSMFARGDETHDLFMPFSEDFVDTFRSAFGIDLLDGLPELFWNLADDAPSQVRYQYHDHTAERFASGFSDTIGEWCRRHGVALTGHMLGEGSLMSQTRGCGEAMRGLRAFDIPGVDILCDKRELTTVKQAVSVARQFGREGVASELYGVTGWGFDFVGHKAQGDWQAALGVAVRVPHLFWMSMRGEAKRDYPASIGEQSPWWPEYALIEDHFARLATVMTRGVPATRVAIIHPIESAWLTWGTKAHNEETTRQLEETFARLPEWLLFGGIDFDYVSERLLVDLPQTGPDELLTVGAMRYACVIVPPVLTLRSTTLARLERFQRAGGTVIFAGEAPALVDAQPSSRVTQFAHTCIATPVNQAALLNALAPFRDLSIARADGSPVQSVLHQLRIDGPSRHLLLVNTDRRKSESLHVSLPGMWSATRLDTLTGEQEAFAVSRDGGGTTFDHELEAQGHLLLTMSPDAGHVSAAARRVSWRTVGTCVGPVPFVLSEPNVLPLDRARLVEADGSTTAEMDVLRLDNEIRARLGLPARNGRGVQPWADASPTPALATIELQFQFHTEIDLPAVDLALEDATNTIVTLDGTPVDTKVAGWWVDQSIDRITLPPLRAGTHTLRLRTDFRRTTEIEAIYLLGAFGVRVDGPRATIIPLPRTLDWGDWTAQGLPFYGGNVTYRVEVPASVAAARLCVPSFCNPLIAVDDDAGRPLGRIAFSPYRLDLPAGTSRLALTAFGNRANTFGPLHHADPNLRWIGPAAWRTTGDAWRDAYQLKPMGILAAPLFEARDEHA